jgi:uncharacterized protein GlcG (DUF336 family)
MGRPAQTSGCVFSLEPLEDRRLLSVAIAPLNAAVTSSTIAPKSNNNGIAQTKGVPNPDPGPAFLTAGQVGRILAQAGSQMRPGQAAVVVDREGKILGIYATPGATSDTILKAAMRARTGGFFESSQDAFSTRTARFIIQDNFPPNIKNTGGGPLYGVEFSDLRGLAAGGVENKTDILGADQTPAVSGDPGGLPLFINGHEPVGGIGVAGDGHDIAARSDLRTNLNQGVYNGTEEHDFDESVALAGELGFQPNSHITANNIFIPGAGLRFPYTVGTPAHANPTQSLAQLVAAGDGSIVGDAFLHKDATIVASVPPPFPSATFAGVPGQLKNTQFGAAVKFGLIPSNDTDAQGNLLPASQRLTIPDVRKIISQAVTQAMHTRAAIRLPIGSHATIHVTVVDRDGDLLGAFRMFSDGTNFSFDVAVQKARTSAFFSDNSHAFSTRAIGFMSQRYFPIGINGGAHPGPLFHLQNDLSNPQNLKKPLHNGITIFPGGEPLYKNGVMVGAIGISGDGVDQDDVIGFGGAQGYLPNPKIRDDELSKESIKSFIVGKVQSLVNMGFVFASDPNPVLQAQTILDKGFHDFRLPYIKMPRHLEV